MDEQSVDNKQLYGLTQEAAENGWDILPEWLELYAPSGDGETENRK